MTKSIYTGLLAVALTACGSAAAKESASDSATGDLKPPRAEGAVVRSTSGRSLADGTRIEATIDKAFSSRTDKAGQTITATVGNAVKDARGNVIIPSGSIVALTIETLDPGNDQIRPADAYRAAEQAVPQDGELQQRSPVDQEPPARPIRIRPIRPVPAIPDALPPVERARCRERDARR